MTGHRIKLPSYKLDKSGKLQRSQKGKSTSQKIVERKNPKKRWSPAK